MPDRKTVILAAAAELFAAQGFAGTGIDEIGERAGISGPAIYRHFRGKDALLRAVVLHALDSYELPDETVSDGLEAMLRAVATTALDRPAFLITYLRERHRLDEEALREIERTEHRLYRPWRDVTHDRNPTLQRDEIARRHRAVITAIGVTAARPTTVARTTLERLMVESSLAVLSVASVPHGSAPARATGWTVEPARRDLILAAALELFRERGYHGVSMDDIGEAIGITGPTIYFHYESKLDVLVAAHERASIRTWVAVQDAVSAAGSASDALDRLAVAQLGVAADHSDLIVVTSREFAVPDAVDSERLEARATEIVDLWISVVGELRPELGRTELRAVVTGVFPLMNQTAYALGRPDDGVPLVRAWALGSAEGVNVA